MSQSQGEAMSTEQGTRGQLLEEYYQASEGLRRELAYGFDPKRTIEWRERIDRARTALALADLSPSTGSDR